MYVKKLRHNGNLSTGQVLVKIIINFNYTTVIYISGHRGKRTARKIISPRHGTKSWWNQQSETGYCKHLSCVTKTDQNTCEFWFSLFPYVTQLICSYTSSIFRGGGCGRSSSLLYYVRIKTRCGKTSLSQGSERDGIQTSGKNKVNIHLPLIYI